MCEPFSSVCAGQTSLRSDSESSSRFQKAMKGGIPYSGTLLLSLVSEKEESKETVKLRHRTFTTIDLSSPAHVEIDE